MTECETNLGILELLLDLLNNASSFQALESALEELGSDLAGACDDAADGHVLDDLGGGQFPELLHQGEVVEGEIDVLVRIVVGDDGRAELHDETLAGALEVGLEAHRSG